jgi:hypothetical protein
MVVVVFTPPYDRSSLRPYPIALSATEIIITYNLYLGAPRTPQFVFMATPHTHTIPKTL